MGTVVNVCFHGIGEPDRELEPGERPYWISVEFFHQILDATAADPRVAYSFDDGNASDAEIGLPALHDRGLRAAFFPLAARTGQTGSLRAEDLRALVAAGMTIGSHGMRHRPWTRMSADELHSELVEARDQLSATAGVPISAAACPLGRYDRRVLGQLRELGYAQVFTSDRALGSRSGWLQPRYSVRESDDIGVVKGWLAGKQLSTGQAASMARIAVKRWRTQ